MGESTGIGWTDHTFNPWMGCQRVSPGCGGAKGVGGCYAEALVTGRMGYHAESADPRRRLTLWGPPSTSTRQRTSAANWKRVVQWDREAKAAGVRRRMFCASLADVFEAHPDLTAIRADLWPLLASCTSLDVQLLTKRPENITAMVPRAWRESWPAHVWIGTTVEDQRRANERIPHLLKVPAAVRFLSVEPLLEAIDLTAAVAELFCMKCHKPVTIADSGDPEDTSEGERSRWVDPECPHACPDCGGETDGRYPDERIQWVIVGGESGSGARAFDLAWARSIVAQCEGAGVPCFVKQIGARPVDSARAAVHQPCIHERRPAIRTTILAASAPEVAQARVDERNPALRLAAPQVEHPLHLRGAFRIDDRAGADPSEWPADLRVQRFPAEVRDGR